MSTRMVLALPIYGVGYAVMLLCGLVALVGATILAIAEGIVTYQRPYQPWRGR
ncbi:MAG: hypothetical protein ACYC8W_06155 [Candidatus Tyrphobacter sp.]